MSKMFTEKSIFDAIMTPGSILFEGGSGLVSQDNANLFWDAPNNRLGIGTSNPTDILHIEGTGDVDFRFVKYGGSPDINIQNAGGTQAVPTALAADSSTGRIAGYGHDGTSFGIAAQIRFNTAEAWSPGNHGGKILFRTVDSGSTGASTKMVIDQDGTLDLLVYGAGKLETDSSGNVTAVTPSAAKVVLGAAVDLGTAYASVLTITLPSAGTYVVTGGIRVNQGDGVFVVARLFDQTGSAVIANSEVLVSFTNFVAVLENQQATAPLAAVLTVTASTTIRLEARESSASASNVVSNTDGRTWLMYQRL